VILVLGGAGFVGGHLLERLLQRDEPVRCGVFSEAERSRVQRAGIEAVCADIRDRAALVRAMRGVRAVVNLVTLIQERHKGDFAAVLHQGVANIVSAAQEVGISRILHMSALAPPAAVDDPSLGYLYWKHQGTDLLASADLDYTIFETSLVFGPGDQHLTALALALKGFRFAGVPRNGAADIRFQPVWVGDLVTCLIKALDDSGTFRRVFPLGGPEILRYRDLVGIVGREIGVKPRIFLAPEILVRLALRIGGALLRYSPVTPDLLALKGVDSTADSTATYEYFDIKPARVAEAIGYLRKVGLKELKAWWSAAPSHAVFGHEARHPG